MWELEIPHTSEEPWQHNERNWNKTLNHHCSSNDDSTPLLPCTSSSMDAALHIFKPWWPESGLPLSHITPSGTATTWHLNSLSPPETREYSSTEQHHPGTPSLLLLALSQLLLPPKENSAFNRKLWECLKGTLTGVYSDPAWPLAVYVVVDKYCCRVYCRYYDYLVLWDLVLQRTRRWRTNYTPLLHHKKSCAGQANRQIACLSTHL